MCSFCFDKIESENKICPGCRTPYNKENYVTKEPTKEELNLFKMLQNKKLHKKKKDSSHSDSSLRREHPHSTSSLSSSTPSGSALTQTSMSMSSLSSSSFRHPNHTSNLSRSTQERSYIHHSSSSISNEANESESDATTPERDLRGLGDTRVVQRNLVYVTNIPLGYISHVNTFYLFTFLSHSLTFEHTIFYCLFVLCIQCHPFRIQFLFH